MRTIDPTRIIVGVDGSDSSIEALRAAARIATQSGAPLEVITTWDFRALGGGYFPIEGWSPEGDARTVQEEAIVRAFGDDPRVDVTRTVLQGAPARTLIEASRQAAMLVVGSRGLGGFMGLLLGSVSAACAEHAHCPVLVVHGKGDAAQGAAA